jgi:hypothetical protein
MAHDKKTMMKLAQLAANGDTVARAALEALLAEAPAATPAPVAASILAPPVAQSAAVAPRSGLPVEIAGRTFDTSDFRTFRQQTDDAGNLKPANVGWNLSGKVDVVDPRDGKVKKAQVTGNVIIIRPKD